MSKWTQEDTKKLVAWALNLKPGETFQACTGFNHYVQSVMPCELVDKDDNVLALEATIIDSNGIEHSCGGSGGCVYYPFSNDEIKNYFLSLDVDYFVDNGWDDNGELRRVVECFKNNEPVMDDKGVKIKK